MIALESAAAESRRFLFPKVIRNYYTPKDCGKKFNGSDRESVNCMIRNCSRIKSDFAMAREGFAIAVRLCWVELIAIYHCWNRF